MLPPHALALIAAAAASAAAPPCPAGTTPQPQPCSGHAGRFYCPSNRTAGQCDVPGNHPASCPKCDNAAPPQRFPLCHCPCAGCPTAAPYGTFAPPFPTTWSLANSTVIGNAGNQNGWLSGNASKYAILTIDWANNKRCWLTQNASESQNAECMVEQARRIKAGGTTKVYVYRNTQQALAIESSSRAVMYDPRYAGFFIRCADGSIYHRATNANDGACGGVGLGPRCTTGNRRRCNGTSDGGIFFWDFRNASCRRYFRDVVVGGPSGTGNSFVDGVFFDDAGPGTEQNPMPEYQNQLRAISAHAGLSDADVMDVANATHTMMVELRASMYRQGKGTWLSSGDPSWFSGFDDHVQGDTATKNWWAAPAAGDTCRSFYTSLCGQRLPGPVAFSYPPGYRHGGWDLPDELSWRLSVATFLLLRPLQAWLVTSTWIDGPEILWDSSLELDVGEPLGNCTQRGSVFTRQWSRGSVRIDCANLSSTVLGFKQARLRTDDERLASGLPPNWHWRQQIHGLPAVANSKDASGIVYTENDGYWPVCMS